MSSDSANDSAADRGLGSATKVTNDPEAEERPEGAGVVISDSLAGESKKNDGSFGEDNPRAGVSDQPSQGTTTNNEDTSGATTLPPADQKSSRDDANEQTESQDLSSGTGQSTSEKTGESTSEGTGQGTSEGTGQSTSETAEQSTAESTGENIPRSTGDSKDEGSDPTYASVVSEAADRKQDDTTTAERSGSSDQTQDAPIGQGERSETFAEDDSNAAPAPTYVTATNLREAEQKPKGKNLTEGGFDDDAKNTSFDAEIGSKDDPGKLAERKFENFGDQPGEEAAESKEGGISGENERYGALEDTEA